MSFLRPATLFNVIVGHNGLKLCFIIKYGLFCISTKPFHCKITDVFQKYISRIKRNAFIFNQYFVEVEHDPLTYKIIGKKVFKHGHCMDKYSGDLGFKWLHLLCRLFNVKRMFECLVNHSYEIYRKKTIYFK